MNLKDNYIDVPGQCGAWFGDLRCTQPIEHEGDHWAYGTGKTRTTWPNSMAVYEPQAHPLDGLVVKYTNTVPDASSPNAQGGFVHADAVDHPNHYRTAAGLEAVDVIEAFGLDWHLGNAIKYVLRAGKEAGEPADKDVEKAVWYLHRWLEKKR